MKKVISNIQEFFENLHTTLVETSGKKMHKARRDFLVKYILGLIQSRSVHSSNIAAHMPTRARTKSDVRRIERFYEAYELDYELVALLIVFCLPQGKLKLSMDRTTWKVGEKWFNILAISVGSGKVGIPIWVHVLDKKHGNSNQEERIDLLKKVIQFIGLKRISIFLADREFIGQKWIKYLLSHKITFYIRLRNLQYFSWQGQRLCVREVLNGKSYRHFQQVRIYESDLHLAIHQPSEEAEIIAILSNKSPKFALKKYRHRWTIEVLFQSLKKRGFDLEATHLQADKRVRKLFMVCSLAFALCHSIGQYLHYKVKAIKTRNHGYLANSFFRKGLESIREAIKLHKSMKNIFKELFKIAYSRFKQFYLYTSFDG